MSKPKDSSHREVETILIPRARDLGDFEVRRALPSSKRKLVGPFIFFDQMGPAEFLYDGGIDVRPHPHIGLSTVTYLFQGEFQHRDSLGTNQMIYPGEVNWMTSGKGITHSERTSPETRKSRHSLYGIQTWVALPENKEDMSPEFEHHKEGELPVISTEGTSVRLILGEAYGSRSPVGVHSEMFYGDVHMDPNSIMPMPDNHEDRAIYLLNGTIEIAGMTYEPGQMLIFRPGDKISVRSGPTPVHFMMLGGATLEGPRHIWWNFVSSSEEKIREATKEWKKANWGNGLFSLPPGDDQEFIPIKD